MGYVDSMRDEPEADCYEADSSSVARIARARNAGRKARKALISPAGIRGTAIEVAWLTAHVAMYPLGLVQEHSTPERAIRNLDELPPVQRGLLIGDVEAAGTPIILVHGIIDNHTVFALLRRGLNRRGFGRVISLNYSPLTDDIRRVAKRLNNLIERVCRETGYERVHVVGHSMGGLIARYYVQRMGGDQRVHTLVTLGSPHEGTMPAMLVPHSVVKQLRPESDVVMELAEPAPGCQTRMVAIWSDLDQMIMPKRNARIVHPDLNARNVFIKGIGHMSLPVDGRVVHEICTTLAHLDHDGTTLAAGATSISSTAGRAEAKRTPARADSVAPNARAAGRGNAGS